MTLSIDNADVPSFDISDPFFSASSAAVAAAREQSWWARTNFGLAVLRYDEVSALLKDRRLRQGSFAWPAQNGIEQGLLSEWWAEIMLSKEGDDHRRLRRLANPAFSRTLIERMGPEFRALADELIDAYAVAGSCEFVSQFAEPYAARTCKRDESSDRIRRHSREQQCISFRADERRRVALISCDIARNVVSERFADDLAVSAEARSVVGWRRSE